MVLYRGVESETEWVHERGVTRGLWRAGYGKGRN